MSETFENNPVRETPLPPVDTAQAPTAGPRPPVEAAQPPAAYGFYPNSQATVPVRRDPFPMERRDYGFAAGLIALCVAVVFMGAFCGFHLGFTLSGLGLFAALSVYLKRPGVKTGPFACACGALAAATFSVFTLCADDQIKLFSCAAVIGLSAVWFDALTGRTEEKGDFGLVRNLVNHVAVNTFSRFGQTWRGLLFSGERKTFGKALIGVLCAVPVAAAAVSLLVKADGAFEAMTAALLENSFLLIVKIVLGLLAGVFVVSYAMGLHKTEPEAQKDPAPGRLDVTYAAAFTAVLCVCYCFYLFSQLAYFFDAFKGMLPEGYEISFSDYARQGFFELCWIAGLNCAVVFAVLLLARPKNGRLHPALKGTCTFICLFTLVVIATAVAKMALYISEYGMTQLRVGTGVFMCLIVAVFVALTLRVYLPKVRVLRVALVSAACAVLLLGAGNYNAFIARYNDAHIYNDNPGSSAADELYMLGPEGVPSLVKLTQCGNPEVAEYADKTLRDLRYDYYDYDYPGEDYAGDPVFDYDRRPKDGFCWYSVPTAKAYAALDEYFAAHPDEVRKEVPTTVGATEPAREEDATR